MPKNESKVTCINHPEIEMLRHVNNITLPGIHAAENAGDFTVDFDAGIMVTTYKCNNCGYIEVYEVDEND